MGYSARKTAIALTAICIAVVLTLHDLYVAQQSGSRVHVEWLATFALSPYVILTFAQVRLTERALALSFSVTLALQLFLKFCTGRDEFAALYRLGSIPLWSLLVIVPLALLLRHEWTQPLRTLSEELFRGRLRQWALYLLVAPVIVTVTPLSSGPLESVFTLVLTLVSAIAIPVFLIASFGGEARRLALRYGTVLWYLVLSLMLLGWAGTFREASKRRASLQASLDALPLERADFKNLAKRYAGIAEAAPSLEQYEQDISVRERDLREQLPLAQADAWHSIERAIPFGLLLGVSLVGLWNRSAAADLRRNELQLAQNIDASTPLLLGIGVTAAALAALVTARGILFYSDGVTGLAISAGIASIVVLGGAIILALARRVRVRVWTSVAVGVALGVVGIMFVITAYRGAQNYWTVNATRELSRLAREFQETKTVVSHDYASWRFGEYAPVLRFMRDFHRSNGRIIAAADHRMDEAASGSIAFHDRSDIVRMKEKFVRLRNEAEAIQRDLNRAMRAFAATAPRYGMSASNQASVVRAVENTIAAEGDVIVVDSAPLYDAADRYCDFLLAHSDALDFDGEGHIVFRSEADEAEAAWLADELEAAGQDAMRTLGERQRANRDGVASIVPSIEGFRDW